MEVQAKKKVHITWEEANRAESERDKARQARCRPMPPSRMKLITVYVSRDLPKLKDSALRLWDVTFNHRLRTSTEMAGANARTSKNRHEAQAEECQRGQFKELVVGLEDKPPEIYFKRGPTKSAIAIFLGIILLAGVGTLSYWQQSKNDLSRLAVKRVAIAQRDLRYTSDPEVTVEGSKAQPVASQLSSTKHEPVQPDGRESTSKTTQGYLGNFDVVDNSFVRDEPQANATIIATLHPGTQVRVESKTGEYLRIRSLNDAEVAGYVHEEDAFFQAH